MHGCLWGESINQLDFLLHDGRGWSGSAFSNYCVCLHLLHGQIGVSVEHSYFSPGFARMTLCRKWGGFMPFLPVVLEVREGREGLQGKIISGCHFRIHNVEECIHNFLSSTRKQMNLQLRIVCRILNVHRGNVHSVGLWILLSLLRKGSLVQR